MESYAPFPFLPAISPGPRGAVYEFRTYRLKPGGLPPASQSRTGPIGCVSVHARL